ncbi:UDP-N-acetylmuramate--L-alanyl-gamma-D-glutamyl-meso-2,6-diaminoheptandioate ligase [Aquicella siphonis]|uniref:UDP-N-acetylmuramate--L-alanyl-gamma-D-glutamyl-meso-2,6-diaminoheptandioate ligase n=2 Tax=Aquicella siphonis TaxID=254247 RepID=A0A5E4PIJ6_9COXI|nr:UDP-N-acetylmuramate--L-alanyl-gamma-D-glutamyl-meso-2,6-diaminoheptandioate ligase [Aquicella siphonis]
MSGIAILAKQGGHEVTGSDMNVYPPMSTQLMEQGIILKEGYDPSHIDPGVECVIVGNVIKRGNPAMEHVLANRLPYVSGPQWLAENVIQSRWVLGVAGTHGKTTTSSLLAWILDCAGLQPGFLIGGVPENFGVSARLGGSPYFVIEADEYDSAFFDKRSKFIHYRPKTLILNNLEFDHADIFPDLAAIKQQFHYLVRTVPGNGLIIRHAPDDNLTDVLGMGCWTPSQSFGGTTGEWQAKLIENDGSAFSVYYQGQRRGDVRWNLLGNHNVDNALAAIAAARHADVAPEAAIEALSSFRNVKRRLEVKGKARNIVVYDDFAHHPTAIATTLSGLRAKIGAGARMIAVLEFGSYTMRSGVHKSRMQDALKEADMVVCKRTETDWGIDDMLAKFPQPSRMYDNVDSLVSSLATELKAGDHVIIMSNSGFDGIHKKLLDALERG